MPSHTKKEVIGSYARKKAAKLRRQEKDELRRETFERTRALAKDAGELMKLYWQVAKVYFYFLAFLVVVSIIFYAYHLMGWVWR